MTQAENERCPICGKFGKIFRPDSAGEVEKYNRLFNCITNNCSVIAFMPVICNQIMTVSVIMSANIISDEEEA